MTAVDKFESFVKDEEILALANSLSQDDHKPIRNVFARSYWYERFLDWAMRDEQFKVDLFRLVDVLPTLRADTQVANHVREYLLRPQRVLPAAMTAGLRMASARATQGLAAKAIRKNVEQMAKRFIAGTHATDSIPALERLRAKGVGFTADLLGEACLSEHEASIYAERYADTIDQLAAISACWPRRKILDTDHLGEIPKTNVSIKLSAMYSQINAADFQGTVAAIVNRLLPIVQKARISQVFINFDVESWHLHALTYAVFEQIATHPELRSYRHLGIVVQAYLRSSSHDIERLARLAKRRGCPFVVRLVKGAYWDYETVRAKQQNWPCPVFTDKGATDANYEACTIQLLGHHALLHPAWASHNLRSICHAIVAARHYNVPTNGYEIQMLYGMGETVRAALVGQRYRVRVYAPIGELIPGMAYLVRRLLENTSNEGFLRQTRHKTHSWKQLLARPIPTSSGKVNHVFSWGDLSSNFSNCPSTDFAIDAQRKAFADALEQAPSSFPVQVPVCIGDREEYTRETLQRYCPSTTDIQVANVCLARVEDVQQAVEIASGGVAAWQAQSTFERASTLERLAEILFSRRSELAALMVWEVGKPWSEADADVAEAIDFCRYYARTALAELKPRMLGGLPGEENRLFYQGRGVCAVIAPWNFPLAILCGMSVAALVAGNTVLLKPAEQSSAVGYALYRAMRQAGVPQQTVQFLPGRGETIGPHLVADPRVTTIAFTGGYEAGTSILTQAARHSSHGLKRVICELGGKNAILVDDDADLDEAVLGVAHSSFAFAGQKCSACSRVFVLRDIAKTFQERLIHATASLRHGPAQHPGTTIGPVVDHTAMLRLQRVINAPGDGATCWYIGETPPDGYFVPPAIYQIENRRHPLLQTELFGPILAVHVVDDFRTALAVANETDYALTAAVYSRRPSHLEQAKEVLAVGNLYLNRGSTGALVNRQPFGGFGLSGFGTKAGGPGYLRHFTNPRVVTENTMRRGFAPELL